MSDVPYGLRCGRPCTCDCHRAKIMHIVACCDKTYETYTEETWIEASDAEKVIAEFLAGITVEGIVKSFRQRLGTAIEFTHLGDRPAPPEDPQEVARKQLQEDRDWTSFAVGRMDG